MNNIDTQYEYLKHYESFITIEGVDFFVGDWLQTTDVNHVQRPSVILSVFSDEGKRSVVIRDECFKKQIYGMSDFVKLVKKGYYCRIPKPKYKVKEVLRNKYTERTCEIIEVPFTRNDDCGEYVYFVLMTTVTYGKNFECLRESDLDNLYQREGVCLK